WLELYNSSANPVALAGLVISDNINVPSPASYRAITNLSFIGADGFIQFFCDDLDKKDQDHLNFKLSSGNGETLTLFDINRSSIIDRVTFGAQTRDVSQGRLPDGAANIVFFP